MSKTYEDGLNAGLTAAIEAARVSPQEMAEGDWSSEQAAIRWKLEQLRPKHEDFAEYPTSVSEARSDKSRSASDWDTRDALISMLRDIDAGKYKPRAGIVIISERDNDSKVATSYKAASFDLHVTIGMLEDAKAHLLK